MLLKYVYYARLSSLHVLKCNTIMNNRLNFQIMIFHHVFKIEFRNYIRYDLWSTIESILECDIVSVEWYLISKSQNEFQFILFIIQTVECLNAFFFYVYVAIVLSIEYFVPNLNSNLKIGKTDVLIVFLFYCKWICI